MWKIVNEVLGKKMEVKGVFDNNILIENENYNNKL